MQREIDIHESIDERIETVGYDRLTEEEQNWYAISWLESLASNGGFEHFFRTVPGTWVFAALRGLSVVGAKSMLACLDAAVNLFPKRRIPDDDDERSHLIDAFTEGEMAEMDKLSNEFTDYPDPLAKLLKHYYSRNKNNFLGPRTSLEMWQSMRARGADTTPVFITKKIDYAKEAKEDRKYSSRSCPHCGYPSPDYRPACKRCGYPHGRA